MSWLQVLKAGEYESKNYTECILDNENYLDSWSMIESFDSNGNIYVTDNDDNVNTEDDDTDDDDTDDDNTITDNEVRYFYFLLDLLDPLKSIDHYEYKLEKWIVEWLKEHPNKQDVMTTFWSMIFRNTSSGFLFQNRYHILLSIKHKTFPEVEWELFPHLAPSLNTLKNICEYEHNINFDWYDVGRNSHTIAIQLMEKYIEELYVSDISSFYHLFAWLCEHPHHIHVIEKYFHSLFEKENTESIRSWWFLCQNENAAHLLEPNKKHWINLMNDDSLDVTDNLSLMVEIPKLSHLLFSDIKEYFDSLNEIDGKAACYEDTPNWILTACKTTHCLPYIEPYLSKLKLDAWDVLCENPNAISFVSSNIQMIDKDFSNKFSWKRALCQNTNAIEILQKYTFTFLNNELEDTYFELLCTNQNPNIITILHDNFTKLTDEACQNLSKNPIAISFLEKYPDIVHIPSLCENTNSDAIALLKNKKFNLDSWSKIFQNPNPEILQTCVEERLDELRGNERLIRKLNNNPNAISIVRKYPELIDFNILQHSSIFKMVT